jgi:hypothetical protein
VGGLLADAVPARVGVVAWEGDADLPGDRLLLDGRPLSPWAGDHSRENVMDGSARGAVGPALSFGTDVDDFPAVLDGGAELALTTRQDAYLPGAISVVAPIRG